MAAPNFTDALSVVVLQKVAAGGCVKATFNVSGKFGGWLFLRAMRLSSSAPSAGIIVLARRLLKGTPAGGSAGVNINHPAPLARVQDNTTASNLTTLNGSPTIPGLTVTLTSATGFAGDQMCGITDSTSSPTIFETGRTSKIASTTLTFDENLTNTALATGHTITNGALILPPIWVDGSPNSNDVEVVFDNGLEATIAYAIEAWGQTLDTIA